jgi:hypothetical protein
MSRHVLLSAGLCWLALPALAPAEGGKGGAKPPDDPAAHTISGPFSHDNLTIFLLHGEDTLSGKPLLTLQEALEQKKGRPRDGAGKRAERRERVGGRRDLRPAR